MMSKGYKQKRGLLVVRLPAGKRAAEKKNDYKLAISGLEKV